MAEKKLKLWNGRFAQYSHGYVAAYSRADAIRLLTDATGSSHGWFTELTVYWHGGCWGNSLIGITPRRGVFAEKTDGSIVELVAPRKEVDVVRDNPEAWADHCAAKQKAIDDYKAAQLQAYQEKCKRARVLFQSINLPVGMSLGIDNDVLTVEWGERKYRIEESE